jgi:hypothetical protein
MPKSAIEVGSGTEAVVIRTVSVIPVALPEKLKALALIGGEVLVTKLHTTSPPVVAAKVAVIVFPGPSVRVTGPTVLDTTERDEIGSTAGA